MTCVFVLCDDDLAATGLTAKLPRDLLETALQVPVRSADQREAIELAGIVLDLLGQSGIRHRDVARGAPPPAGGRFTRNQTPPRPNATPSQAATPTRLDLAS